MKKYLVVYVILSPHVAEQFDNEEDASAFAEIMNRRYPERFYTVFKMNNIVEEGK